MQTETNFDTLYSQKLSSLSKPVGENSRYLIQKNGQQLIEICLRELNEKKNQLNFFFYYYFFKISKSL